MSDSKSWLRSLRRKNKYNFLRFQMKVLPDLQNFRIYIFLLCRYHSHYPPNRRRPANDIYLTAYYCIQLRLRKSARPEMQKYINKFEIWTWEFGLTNSGNNYLVSLNDSVALEIKNLEVGEYLHRVVMLQWTGDIPSRAERIYLVTGVPLPGVLGDKWSEVCIPDVGNCRGKSQQSSCYLDLFLRICLCYDKSTGTCCQYGLVCFSS